MDKHVPEISCLLFASIKNKLIRIVMDQKTALLDILSSHLVMKIERERLLKIESIRMTVCVS